MPAGIAGIVGVEADGAGEEGEGRLLRLAGKAGQEHDARGKSGAAVTARDLRAGAALIIAGLTAKGTTYVDNIHYVERGYERLIEKMSALGADIKVIEE